MMDASYGMTKSLGKMEFGAALQKVTRALEGKGFGVLTEIDVKATLKKKLDLDFRNYRILGACNPPLAHRALAGEPMIGLLLPCNVVVLEEDDGTITVSAARPTEMFKIVDNPNVAPLAREVEGVLQQVMEQL